MKMTIISRKGFVFLIGAVMSLTFNYPIKADIINTTVNQVSLTDIDSHWAKESIVKAVEKGFVDGYPDGTFDPDKAITRAEFLTMLTKSKNVTRYPVPGNNEWYAPYIGAMEVEGVVRGSDQIEDWNAEMSRQELARFAYRASDKQFQNRNLIMDDAAITFRATKAGLIQGEGHGELALDKTTTRAQAVTILDRVNRVLAGEALEVDRYALSAAEINLTGTNAGAMLGIKLKPFPIRVEMPQGVTAVIHQLIVADLTDPNDPYRNKIPPMEKINNGFSKDAELYMLALRVTVENPEYLNREQEPLSMPNRFTIKGFSRGTVQKQDNTAEWKLFQTLYLNEFETAEGWFVCFQEKSVIDKVNKIVLTVNPVNSSKEWVLNDIPGSKGFIESP